jgi:hypothetical protein
MADTYTTNLNLTKPEPGAAEDTWGISLNADLDSLDAIFGSGGTAVSMGAVTLDGLTVDGVGSLDNNGLNLELSSSNTGIIYDAQNGYHTFKRNGTNALQINGGNGDIAFYDDTGTTKVFFYDASAERLGIGTTSPSEKLTLRSTQFDTTHISIGDSVERLRIGYLHAGGLASSTSASQIGSDSSSDLSIAAPSNGASEIKFFTNTASGTPSEALRIDSSQRVGIGTSSPQGNLHVEGAAGVSGGGIIYVTDADNGSTASDALQISKSGDTAFIYNRETSGNLQLGAGGNANHMIVRTDGKVGIGTSSPSYALDVRDNSNILLQLASTTASNNARMVFAPNNTAIFNVGVDVSSSDFTWYDVQTATSPIKIEQGAATNSLVLKSDGKLGIGTGSANAPLHVKSSIDYITRFESTDTTAGIVLQDSSSSSRVTNTGGNLILSADINNEASNSAIRFMLDTSSNTGTDAAMVLKSTGLGIGIPSPNSGSKLHIRGTDGASGASTNVAANEVFIENNGNVGITLGTPNTGTGYYAFADSDIALRAGIFYDHSTDDMGFRVASSTAMTIDSNRNVGIGTSSPARNLHVHASNFTDLHLTNDTTGATASDGTSFTAIGSDIYLTNREAGNMVFQTSGTERARIDSSGNLAIGNISAAAKLDIRQDSGSAIRCEDGSGAYFVVKQGGLVGIGTPSPDAPLTVHNSSDPEIRFGYSSTQDHKIAWDSSKVFIHADPENANGSSAIGFAVDGTERARIDSSGNFGIGTSSPSANLHVKLGGIGDDSISLVESQGSATYGVYIKSTYAEEMGRVGALSQADGGLDGASIAFKAYGRDIVFNTNEGSNNAERARFLSGGAFLIGKTALGVNTQGLQFNGGLLAVTKDGAQPLILNRKTTDGVVVDLRKDNNTGGIIGIQEPQDNAEELYIANGTGTSSVGLAFWDYINTSRIAPCNGTGAYQDNSIDLGYSGARFDDIYATNGTIQTSDRNEKQDIQALTDAEQRVATACKGLIRRFRWQDAVEEKGDDARLHFGVIAQDLQDAFTAEGLDAGDYGMFISSTWEDDDGVEQTRLGVRYNELLAFIITTL